DSAAALAVVEDAVAIVLLAQRPATLRQPRVQSRHLLDRFAAEGGDSGQLRVVDPDVARGASTAVAAARAAEAEPVLEPRLAHCSLPRAWWYNSSGPRSLLIILTGRSFSTNGPFEESDGRESLHRHSGAQRGGL